MAGAWTRSLARWHLGRGVGPVRWARWGPVSRLLAGAFPCARPYVLVLSLPRSGSSWVGHILGCSPGALYLREPFTQTGLESGDVVPAGTFGDGIPPSWEAVAGDVRCGLPRFHGHVVEDPHRWRLSGRRERRLVVKEVRPQALPWFLRVHPFRVVYLIRHPAAVALSLRAMAWRPVPDAGELDAWRQEGERQADRIRHALSFLAGREDATVVRYEDLCLAPSEGFRSLYRFAGLPWSDAVERAVDATSTSAEPYRVGAYDLERRSRDMVDRWRREIPPDALSALAEGWFADPPAVYSREAWEPPTP